MIKTSPFKSRATSGPWVGSKWAMGGQLVGHGRAEVGHGWAVSRLQELAHGTLARPSLYNYHVPRTWWVIKSGFCLEFVHVLNLSRC